MIGLPVRKLLVASSMSIYGEGLMSDPRGRPVETAERTADDLRGVANGTRKTPLAGLCARFPRRRTSGPR